MTITFLHINGVTMKGMTCRNDKTGEATVEHTCDARAVFDKLAIIVVTYKRQQLLEELLASFAQLTVAPWRIVIVDEKGETVGSYTLTPSGDDADDYDHTAVDWIMWRDGSENTVTVTRGQAPGEPAPDSSDGSGSSSGDGSAGESSSGD